MVVKTTPLENGKKGKRDQLKQTLGPNRGPLVGKDN